MVDQNQKVYWFYYENGNKKEEGHYETIKCKWWIL
jgi:hypothetical protein